MHDALFMSRFKSIRNLESKHEGFFNGNRALAHPIGQRVSFNQFQNKEPRAAGFLETVNHSDVRMVQRRPYRLPTSSTPRITFGSFELTIHSRVSRLPLLEAGVSEGDST